MGYISTSTNNPLGWRAYNAQLTQPVIPRAGFQLSGVEENRLRGYYPANYFVPTPLNITMRPQANIYDACPDGTSARDLSGLGDFINNIQYLRPGQWRSRDDDFSPIPRIYRPPEGIPLSHYGLGDADTDNRRRGLLDFLFRRRPRFSGGAIGTDPADPRGFFFPRTPAQPLQFPATPGLVVSPNPGDPHGVYFPRVPTPVVPAWLRARKTDWTGADMNHLLQTPAGMSGLLGHLALLSAVSISSRTPVAVKPQPVRTPVTALPPEHSAPITVRNQPAPRFPTPVGPVRTSPPIVTTGGPQSPTGRPIPTQPPVTAPIVNPGTPPTLPPGTIASSGGICTVESSPETGSVISTVPCNTLPGYSPGTPPSVTYPGQPGYPSGGYPNYPAPSGWVGAAPASTAVAGQMQLRAYQQALAVIAAGGTLTSAQLAQFSPSSQASLIQAQNNYAATSGSSLTSAVAALNAGQPLTAAQQAALTAAGYTSGGAAAAPAAAATDGTATDSTADVLGWLSQSTLITGVPNWVIAGGGGLLVLWIMNRGKK